jgi:hypothetical protein
MLKDSVKSINVNFIWEVTLELYLRSGVANPRPTKFLWPKLESRSIDFSIIWDSSDFCYFASQKSIFLASFSSCDLQTNLGWPPLYNMMSRDQSLRIKNNYAIRFIWFFFTISYYILIKHKIKVIPLNLWSVLVRCALKLLEITNFVAFDFYLSLKKKIPLKIWNI